MNYYLLYVRRTRSGNWDSFELESCMRLVKSESLKEAKRKYRDSYNKHKPTNMKIRICDISNGTMEDSNENL